LTTACPDLSEEDIKNIDYESMLDGCGTVRQSSHLSYQMSGWFFNDRERLQNDLGMILEFIVIYSMGFLGGECY
jgi:hypothetical protein